MKTGISLESHQDLTKIASTINLLVQSLQYHNTWHTRLHQLLQASFKRSSKVTLIFLETVCWSKHDGYL